MFSSATKDPFRDRQYRSISIGLLINKQLERKLKFLKDEKIKTQDVGVTCERCSIKNCAVRQAPAIVIDKAIKNKNIEYYNLISYDLMIFTHHMITGMHKKSLEAASKMKEEEQDGRIEQVRSDECQIHE